MTKNCVLCNLDIKERTIMQGGEWTAFYPTEKYMLTEHHTILMVNQGTNCENLDLLTLDSFCANS